jgi:hypothetical protein
VPPEQIASGSRTGRGQGKGTHFCFEFLPTVLLQAVASTTCATASDCCSLARARTKSFIEWAQAGSANQLHTHRCLRRTWLWPCIFGIAEMPGMIPPRT